MGVTTQYPTKNDLLSNLNNYVIANESPTTIRGKYLNWIFRAIINLLPDAVIDTTGIIYVNADSGSDIDGNGTFVSPYASIGFAQEQGKSGMTISVAGAENYYVESNLGKDFITYQFSRDAYVRVATGQSLWTDTPNGYTVLGGATFETAPGEQSSTFINWFYGDTRKIKFQFNQIIANCSYAVVNISNQGGGITMEGSLIENTNTTTSGRVVNIIGNLFGNENYPITVNVDTIRTSVEGYTFAGSAAENGTCVHIGGTNAIVYVKARLITNINALNDAPIVFLRTGSRCNAYFNANIVQTYPSPSWAYAGILQQGGKLTYVGNITVTNGSCYVASNFGAVQKFNHVSGTFESINGSAVVGQGTGVNGYTLEYALNGSYISENTSNIATVQFGINGLWRGNVYFGLLNEFSVIQKTAGKKAIRLRDNYSGRIFSLDGASLVGGTGYTNPGQNNVVVTGGTGSGARVNYTTNGAGVVESVTINNPGRGYSVGDVLTISGGGGNATIEVLTADEDFGNYFFGSGFIGVANPADQIIEVVNNLFQFDMRGSVTSNGTAIGETSVATATFVGTSITSDVNMKNAPLPVSTTLEYSSIIIIT